MKIVRNKIRLDKRYITEPLDTESLGKVISSNNPGIVHRIYLIKNGVTKRQVFLEVDDDDNYIVNANVSINYAYAGAAKKQAEVIGFMRGLVRKKPEFIVNFTVSRKSNMEEIFNFKHITTNVEELVEIMNKLEIKTYELCKVNTY
ncbi:MAG: hypothetical protein CMC65_07380 [Flavobacteriaceae bacterium]|nr:hypothetical protein [Flavobacteriaceae bacterium]|tara:strand:- start:1135 stop:1572 length:438 start_codon:yes stop_codon:yes gene_type:complete